MKKTFPLNVADGDARRALDAAKLDVRKYVKRERRKRPPEETVEWAFNCRVGASAETALPIDVEQVVGALDAAASAGEPSLFVEIVAVTVPRPPKKNYAPAAGDALPPSE